MTYPWPHRDGDTFYRTLETELRRPILGVDVAGATTARFEPDLSAAEQALYARLLRLHRSRLGLTPAEYDALAPDLNGLRNFVALASPTAAQTAAATKALIRVLRAILD